MQGHITCCCRISAMPPQFFFGVHTFFFWNTLFSRCNRWMWLLQVFCKVKSIGTARDQQFCEAKLIGHCMIDGHTVLQVLMQGHITCCWRSAMPPQFFLECTLFSFRKPFFLPMQLMDAATAGILQGQVDWRCWRSAMPPLFFLFESPAFFQNAEFFLLTQSMDFVRPSQLGTAQLMDVPLQVFL